MKRDFLTNLGLETEQIDSIMKEHGKTVNGLKDELDKVDEYKGQIEDLQGQIKERDTQLEELSAKAKGNEELTEEIEKLKQANKDTATEYQDKLNKQAFEFKLEKALSDAKAKNTKAVKALLDLETIKLDGDSLVGLNDQLEKLQSEADYLFGDDKLGGRDPHIPNQQSTELTKEKFAQLSYSEKAQLYQENPDLYNQLKN